MCPGPRGNTKKNFEAKSNCTLLLRGKGSIVEEKRVKGKRYVGEELPIHAILRGDSEEDFKKGVTMLEKMIVDELCDPVAANYRRLLQLNQLSVINNLEKTDCSPNLIFSNPSKTLVEITHDYSDNDREKESDENNEKNRNVNEKSTKMKNKRPKSQLQDLVKRDSCVQSIDIKHLKLLTTHEDTLVELYVTWHGASNSLNLVKKVLRKEPIEVVKIDITDLDEREFPEGYLANNFPKSTIFFAKKGGEAPIEFKDKDNPKDIINFIAKHATKELQQYDRNGNYFSSTDFKCRQ